jgi:hypothetical protein
MNIVRLVALEARYGEFWVDVNMDFASGRCDDGLMPRVVCISRLEFLVANGVSARQRHRAAGCRSACAFNTRNVAFVIDLDDILVYGSRIDAWWRELES